MASIQSEDSNRSDDDDKSPRPSTEDGFPDRSAKRRRLNGSTSGTDYETQSDGIEDEEAEKGADSKPRSKYKIHIPKNQELPRDAFFTQPPQRSSSPYRIDPFHWQKPRKPSPQPPVHKQAPYQSWPQNPHVNTISSIDDSFEHNGFKEVSHTELAPPSEHSDEYEIDDIDDEMLAELEEEKLPQYQRLQAPLANLRQTTLFGTQAPESSAQVHSSRKHNWPLANREEALTHHKLDREALATWVYPTNLGAIRDYQYSIVARGLYHNMLVALPTGLGKTFIAATIMLNWFRWATEAQIVFVAPTKPLVSQQVKACFDIAGIPRSATTMLTGGISPGLRAEEWQRKRVFFMTPQTIINDLKTGICDPKKVILLVVDEAHRATGGYAYVEVVKFVKRFNSSFRVLALTATPGSTTESVQEVIDGLGISRVEIRTEESLDIRQYVHSRKIETVLFENSEEMSMVMELFARAIQPVLDKLTAMNAYWARDPMTLTPYGCTQARQRWMASDAGRKANWGVKGMVNTIFSLLASLSHGIELLKFHGIGPFYHKVLAFRNEIHAGDKKGSRYANQINESEPFQTMMSRVQIWINSPEFVGHPKLEYLQRVVMNHFLDAGEGRGASDPSSTRIMVFSHYRDSAEEIARVLKRNEPMIRPHVFVGQANSKSSDGMDQKKQLEIIKDFQSGKYNTLVATSIGEEGLDIGEVDLIVCYDASASPIRMLQRMGRTGRKRAGNIVVTLMKGKEENNFIKAKDNYEKMQVEIASGARFNFHDEESRRIVPRDIQPVVDKRIIDIPPENTQPDLPEPTRRGRAPKRPLKKFHMPDGVRTGFVKASRLDDDEASDNEQPERTSLRKSAANLALAIVPSLEEVFLTPTEEQTFERDYLNIKGDTSQIVEIPRIDSHPNLQRSLRPIKNIRHGRLTRRVVGTLNAMHSMTEIASEKYNAHLHGKDRAAGLAQAAKRAKYWKNPREPASLRLSSKEVSPAQSNRKTSLVYRNGFETRKSTSPVELSSEDDLCNLLGDEEDDAADAASSKSSPPPTVKGTTPFGAESGSECDFPDFNTLIKKGESTKIFRASQRRGGRKVVDDDSDEE